MTLSTIKASTSAKSPNYRWVIIITWIVGHVWSFTVIDSLGFLLPGMRKDLLLTPIQEGLLGSAPTAAAIFLSIPAGWLLSRIRPKLLTSIALFLAAGFTLLQGWAPFYALLFLGRFFFGLTIVARGPARALLIRQWVPPREIVVVNAIDNFLFGFAAIGIILIPIVLELLDNSWRNTLYLFGGISLGIALLWQLMGKERTTPEYLEEISSQQTPPIASILKYKELWLIGMGMIGVSINWSGYITFWPSFMLDHFEISLKTTASLIAISGGISAFAGIVIGYFISRAGKKKLILWVGGFALAFSTAGLLWTDNYPILALLSIVNGMAWAFFPVMMTIPFELKDIKPREIAVAIAFIETALWTGAFLGPLIAGGLHEVTGNLRLALMVNSLAPLTLAAGGLLLPQEWNKPVEERLVLEG